jgi:hypothetical protein
MEVYDCNSTWTSEQFNIQASVVNSDVTNLPPSSTGSNNPCANFCGSYTTMGVQSFQSGNIGSNGACYQSSLPNAGFQVSNMTGRSFSINGVSNPSTLPTKINGGYCFQFGSGGFSYASFSTW